MECIFCKINNGDIPSKILYEDEVVKVIMDIDPSSNGHMLIIPIKHFEDFLEIDESTITHIHKITKLIKKYIYESLNPDGLTLTNNYGINQAVKHYHLHLIPVYKEKVDLLDIKDVYQKIKSVM